MEEVATPILPLEELSGYLKKYDDMSFRKLVAGDALRYRGWSNAISHWGFWLVFSYRVCHLLHRRRLDFFAQLLQLGFQFIFKCEINRKCRIGPGFAIFHGMGIFIGPYVRIGKQVTINSGAFIASNDWPEEPGDYPVLGDNILIGSGAKIIGPITIGSKVLIGPNAVVMKNVKPESSVLPPTCLVVAHASFKGGTAANSQVGSLPVKGE